MKRIYFSSLVLLLLISANMCHAQRYGYGNSSYGFGNFWNMDPYKSRFYEIGFASGVVRPSFEVSYLTVDSKGRQSEKKAYGNSRMKYNLGIVSTGSFQLAKLSSKSALALNVGGQATFAALSFTDKDLNIKGGSPFTFDWNVYNITFPFSLDIKVGAEGASDRSLKSMYTFGAGAALRTFIFEMGSDDVGLMQVSPFLKVEAGYFAGIAFKLRAQYFIGSQVWSEDDFDFNVVENAAPDSKPFFRLSSGGDLVFSLILMPFSRAWDEY